MRLLVIHSDTVALAYMRIPVLVLHLDACSFAPHLDELFFARHLDALSIALQFCTSPG